MMVTSHGGGCLNRCKCRAIFRRKRDVRAICAGGLLRYVFLRAYFLNCVSSKTRNTVHRPLVLLKLITQFSYRAQHFPFQHNKLDTIRRLARERESIALRTVL